MILLTLLIIPFLSGLVLLLFRNGKTAQYFALTSAIVNLLVTAYMIFSLPFPDYSINWINFLGIRFSLGCDGISLIMILLTNLIFPFIILAGFKREQKHTQTLNFLILFIQTALLGVFTARNAFLFYVFWELVLIPVYFLLLIWGGDNKKAITLKFFIFTLSGSLFLLFGIIFLYLQTPGAHSTDFPAFSRLNIPVETQKWLFWVLFIAFAIKMPVFPFHTWQPQTYNMASTQGVMILAGVMTKMGIYGALRFLIPVVPLGVLYWQNTVIILCLSGAIYASVIAFRQSNLKVLTAYASMAHISLMAAAIFVLNQYALKGLLFQALSHGFIIIALFYAVCFINEQTGTFDLRQMGGLKLKLPNLAILLLIIILGSIAIPLTAGFVGEFLMITGLFRQSFWFAFIGATTMVFGAVYMLYAYQRAMLGNSNSSSEKISDIKTLDYLILIPLIAMILILGIYPNPIFDLMGEPVNLLQYQLKTVAETISGIAH